MLAALDLWYTLVLVNTQEPSIYHKANPAPPETPLPDIEKENSTIHSLCLFGVSHHTSPKWSGKEGTIRMCFRPIMTAPLFLK